MKDDPPPIKVKIPPTRPLKPGQKRRRTARRFQRDVAFMEAVRMRVAGHDLREIASAMGVSHDTVRRWLKKHIDEGIRDSVEDLTKWEMTRLEEVRRMILTELEAAKKRPKNHPLGLADDADKARYFKLLIDVSARESALLGLDAPKRAIIEGSANSMTGILKALESGNFALLIATHRHSGRELPPALVHWMASHPEAEAEIRRHLAALVGGGTNGHRLEMLDEDAGATPAKGAGVMTTATIQPLPRL